MPELIPPINPETASNEQLATLKTHATEADRKIRHLQKDQVLEQLSFNKTLILFFGRTDCEYTQGYTPTWLSLQTLFDSQYPSLASTRSPLVLAKVQCGEDRDFCKRDMKALAFPGINWYNNGRLVSNELPVLDYQGLWAKVKMIADNVLVSLDTTDVLEAEPTLSKEDAKRLKKKMIKDAADKADLSITQLETTAVKAKTAQGTHLLFYGATYCPFTQKFTPKWLEFQNLYDSKPEWNALFSIYKVQCAPDEEFCVGEGVDGYPTLFFYSDGVRLEEVDTDFLVPSVEAFVDRMSSGGGSHDSGDFLPVEANVKPVPIGKTDDKKPLANDDRFITLPIVTKASESVHLITHNPTSQKLEASVRLFQDLILDVF
ncbi:UNVERIFIED_CONTAM: hypothetical protein HDU68_011811 [Siphonaria sp. JEL0065]|nr:hypothetical protein HDU68_011811 [Siphonaria sp. JEL0065]